MQKDGMVDKTREKNPTKKVLLIISEKRKSFQGDDL